ncbi:MAG: hypothetical protein ACUVUD_06210 [bacterium]
MKKLGIIFLALLGLVFAQSPERVLLELRRTDEVIERVRVIVEPSENSEAQKVLLTAIEIQTTAWEGYRGRRYRWALSRTFAARQGAWQALDLVVNNPERVAAELDRTERLMQEAEPIVNRVDDQMLQELWQMARSEQSAAWENFRARRFRMALRFTITARQHTGVALRLVRQTLDPGRVEEELNRTEQVRERARIMIVSSNNSRAQKMFEQAGEWQVQAHNRFRERRFGRALRLTIASRDLTLRAWALVSKGDNQKLLETALSETDRLIDRWAGEVERQNNREARRLLEEARRYQQEARELQKAGKFGAALESTTQAWRLMSRSLEIIESNTPASDSE